MTVKKKKPPELTRDATLAAVPVKNEMVSEEETREGDLILLLKRHKRLSYRVLSKIFVIPEEKKFSLDGLGRWVWERCDGENTVGGMVKQLSESFKLSRREAEVSLMSFLRHLSKKKLIGFVLPVQKKQSRRSIQ